jgi:hypothetical protein
MGDRLRERVTTTQGRREQTRWNHQYSEFETGTLVRQRNGTWRITISRVCGGSSCGPRNGVAHDHRATNTMSEQEAVNLLLDWGERLEEVRGLEDYLS